MKIRFIKNPIVHNMAYANGQEAIVNDDEGKKAINLGIAIEISTEKGDEKTTVKVEAKTEKKETKVGKKKVEKRN